jgi:hypothetical protein
MPILFVLEIIKILTNTERKKTAYVVLDSGR